MLFKESGEALNESPEPGDIICEGVPILQLTSLRMVSMVTFWPTMEVSSTSGGEEDAGEKFCGAERDESKEEIEQSIDAEDERIFDSPTKPFGNLSLSKPVSLSMRLIGYISWP